jgi:antitoxin component YwqK of YwqJK toxin-antitoxin module
MLINYLEDRFMNRARILFSLILITNYTFSQSEKKQEIRANWLDSLNRKQGEWSYFLDNTDILQAKYNYKNDSLDGLYSIFWYNTGNLKEQGYFKKGIRDSFYFQFWQNGNPRIQTYIKNGKAHGIMKTFNENGVLTSSEKYIYGFLDSNFRGNLRDSSLKWNGQLPIKIDTIIEQYKHISYKQYAIYINDTIVKKQTINNKFIDVEEQYEKGMLSKILFYQKNKPNILMKILYYKLSPNWSKELPYMSELFDKKGRLVQTEIRGTDNKWEIVTPHSSSF